MNRAITFLHNGADWPRRLEQSVTVLIGLLVFLNPFPHMTALKEMTFYGALAIVLYLLASGKKHVSWSSPLTIPFLLLFGWSTAGIFFAIDRANSLHDVLYHLLKYITLFFLLITFYPSRRHLQALGWIVILSTTIFVTAALVHFYVILGHGLTERLGYNGRYSIFEVSANYLGFITVFTALLSMNKFMKEDHRALKALLTMCFIVTVSATLLTQTRGAIIALLLAIILLGMSNRRGLFFVVILLPILIAPFLFATAGPRERFSMESMQRNERFGIVLMYWGIIKEHPVMGIGFGMELLQRKEFMTPYYEKVPEAYRDPGFNVSPHNFFLDVTVRLGAVGLLLYLGIIFVAFRMTWQSRGSAAESLDRSDARCLAISFGAVLVQSIFADSSFGAPAIVFYLHLAMITILWKESREIQATGGRFDAVRSHE